MPFCLIALGANLGDRQQTLQDAVAQIAARDGVRLVACSRWHETAPIGGPAGQSTFLNGAALIETSLGPESLLAEMDTIEAGLGRERRERWAARTLDLDLLLYGEMVLERPDLKVPHPRMAFRRFVLQPAAEIAPQMIHPELGWDIARLYDHLQHAPPYAAIAGGPNARKLELALEAARRTGANLVCERHQEPFARLFTATDRESPHAIISWMDAQAALLRSVPTEQDRWTLSDFWFDQALACAADALVGEDAQRVHQRMQTLRDDLPSPKLLVLLTSSQAEEQSFTQEAAIGEDDGAEWIRQCQLAIEQQVIDSRPCPTLKLNGADLRQAAGELAAAMEAMR